MGEAFRLGGWGMYPTLLIGALLVIAAGRYAHDPARRRLTVVVATAIVTFLSGCLGFVTGAIRTLTHASGLSASDLGSVIAQGIGESLINIGFALCLVVLAGILTIVGLVRRPAPPAMGTLVDPLRG